jgi:abortive infection bacteriophage resistance protein
MKYIKPALSFEEQAQLLMNRGLIVTDKNSLINCLRIVNYYRLSAYWYTFKKIDPNTGNECFKPGTTFEMIWRRYTFDRELRLLIMNAIEHVEIAILRTQMVEHFTRIHGPFGYCNITNFNPRFDPGNYAKLLEDIDTAVRNSNEEFVSRFYSKYTSEIHLPLWIVVEVMTFGQLFTLFRNLNHKEQQELSNQYYIFSPVMISWLHTLNFIRNACAHHARIWNRIISIEPKIPEKRNRPEWHFPIEIDNRKIYAVLTLLRYLLKFIDPKSDWQNRLEDLLKSYPDVPISWMGFPNNWLECPIWK